MYGIGEHIQIEGKKAVILNLCIRQKILKYKILFIESFITSFIPCKEVFKK